MDNIIELVIYGTLFICLAIKFIELIITNRSIKRRWEEQNRNNKE